MFSILPDLSEKSVGRQRRTTSGIVWNEDVRSGRKGVDQTRRGRSEVGAMLNSEADCQAENDDDEANDDRKGDAARFADDWKFCADLIVIRRENVSYT